MNERASILYRHVVRELSAECSHVEALDQRFMAFASDVRRIERDGVGSSVPEGWEREWNRIEALLVEIQQHAGNARKRLEQPVVPESDPLEEWKPVAVIEDEVEALLAKRKLAADGFVSAEKRTEWEAGWLALETNFSTLRAHSRSVHVKLELQRRFGKGRAAELAVALAEKLPEDLRDPKGIDAFHKAVEELQADRQEFHGVWDVLKALALWVESPEERARKIRGSELKP